MVDLLSVPIAILYARGKYATTRAAHEDKLKELQSACGALGASAAQILRKMQPGEDEIPGDVDKLLAEAKGNLKRIERLVTEIEGLAKQRAELKKEAWGRK